jgi:hypothetical protein
MSTHYLDEVNINDNGLRTLVHRTPFDMVKKTLETHIFKKGLLV